MEAFIIKPSMTEVRCRSITGGGNSRAGRYVIWSEVQIAGRQVFAPFWFKAEE